MKHPTRETSDAADLSGPDFSRRFARHLGAGTDVAAGAVRTFYQHVAAARGDNARNDDAQEAFVRWKTHAAVASGHDLESSSAALGRLATCYGLAPREASPAKLLFSVHTYYAMLVRLIVWQWMWLLDGMPESAETLRHVQNANRLENCMDALRTRHFDGPSAGGGIFRDDLFSWYATAWSEPLVQVIRRANELLLDWHPDRPSHTSSTGGDLLSDLYQKIFPRPVRHALGEYYTPDWLAEHLLDEIGYHGDPTIRILDPTCGSGRFLIAAIRRVRAWHTENEKGLEDGPENGPEGSLDESKRCRLILANIVGRDLHPLAVLSARANYLIALGPLVHHLGDMEIPVRMGDSILRPKHENRAEPDDLFDFVVGNPPWIAWDHLPVDYREATKPLWRRYGLFSLSGSEARHGGGKKDLAMLMLYRCADLDLNPTGRLGMVITQTLLQTKGAGDGFRRFRLGSNGPGLRVLEVHDLVEIRPFADAANWTSTIVLEKGAPTEYPVPYIKWTPGSASPGIPSETGRPKANQRHYKAEPIDPTRPSSPWFLRPPGFNVPIDQLIGASDYQAHLGANSGGANGVYWVELLGRTDQGVSIRNVTATNKRTVRSVRHTVEADLLYPLLRWGDIGRYRATPSTHLLLVQDVETRRGLDEAVMGDRYPQTLAYLSRFRKMLADRAAYQRYQHRAPFYSMYNVGPYTVAPIKVVWRRMDRRINASVVQSVDDRLLGHRAVVPQETCVLVAVETLDEAHYLCAVLNSTSANFLVASHGVSSGKGFGTPSMLDYLQLGRFEPDRVEHVALADASRRAHRAAAQGEPFAEIQDQIDQLAAVLWGLDGSCQTAIRRELELRRCLG